MQEFNRRFLSLKYKICDFAAVCWSKVGISGNRTESTAHVPVFRIPVRVNALQSYRENDVVGDTGDVRVIAFAHTSCRARTLLLPFFTSQALSKTYCSGLGRKGLMNAILRQIILLVMLITLFQQLLPDGKMKQAGKMGLGLVMLLMLVTFLSDAVNLPYPNVNAATVSLFKSAPLANEGSYRDATLSSFARQLTLVAKKAANNAGFSDVEITVSLSNSGEIENCQVAFSLKKRLPSFRNPFQWI